MERQTQTLVRGGETPISELTRFIETVYGVPAMESRILISSLLPTRYPPVWIMIQAEANEFTRHLAYSTRRIAVSDIMDTWHFRGERPRTHNRMVATVLAERDTTSKLFADRFWHWPGPPIWKTSRYPLLMQQCVRMRFTLAPDRFPAEVRMEELYDLVRAALAAWPASRSGIVPAPPTEDLTRRAMILPLIDRLFADRPALMRNLCFVAANHAAICGRTEVAKEDLQAQAYVLKSCVPIWMEKIIGVFMSWGALALSMSTIIDETGFDNAWRNRGSRANPFRLGEKLVKDLWTNGLLERNQNGRFRIRPEFVDDLQHILEARL